MRSATTIDRQPPVRTRSDRLRWHGNVARIETSRATVSAGVGRNVVTIVPESANGPLTAEFVARAVAVARRTGGPSARIVTPALTIEESVGFLDAGFVATSRLHLLVHDLDDRSLLGTQRLATTSSPHPGARLRRGRSGDIGAALSVDGRAFEPPWCLDPAGLDAARRATPISRFRVVEVDGRVVGFCVTGRSGRRGYLQRLAVDPQCQGGGLGLLLVADALTWCRRRSVRRVVVNTQVGNVRALALYRAVGFVDTPVGLCILERHDLTDRTIGVTAPEWGP